MKRKSLKLDDIDWQALQGIASDHGCKYRGEPSFRRLVRAIARGEVAVVNRPSKRVRDFQEQMRRPMREQEERESLAKCHARAERDRWRQEKNRLKAGISPRRDPHALSTEMSKEELAQIIEFNNVGDASLSSRPFDSFFENPAKQEGTDAGSET